MAAGSNPRGVDAAAAMVLALLLMGLTAHLIGRESGALRWYPVPTGFGAVGLCGWMVRGALRAELSQGTQVRVARAITQGERALATWSSGPAGGRRLGRFERLTGRLLPEMATGLRRACHEHVIAVWGRRL